MKFLIILFGLFTYSGSSFAYVDIYINKYSSGGTNAKVTVIKLVDFPSSNAISNSVFSTEEIWQILKPAYSGSRESVRFSDLSDENFQLKCTKDWHNSSPPNLSHPYRACEFTVVDSWLNVTGSKISMKVTGADAEKILNGFVGPSDHGFFNIFQSVEYKGSIRNFSLNLNWLSNTVILQVEKNN